MAGTAYVCSTRLSPDVQARRSWRRRNERWRARQSGGVGTMVEDEVCWDNDSGTVSVESRYAPQEILSLRLRPGELSAPDGEMTG